MMGWTRLSADRRGVPALEQARGRVLLLFAAAVHLVSSASAAAADCAVLESDLESLLAHDECRISDDCVTVKLPEPWGCFNSVNRRYLGELKRAYEDYNAACGPFLFSCLAHPLYLRCEKGHCKAVRSLVDRFPNNRATDENGRPAR